MKRLGMKYLQPRVAAAIVMLCLAAPLPAQDSATPPAAPDAASLAGHYVHSRMELVAELLLNADGTFRYGLTVGSYDEYAQGRWTRSGDGLEFTSDPRPVPPTITAGKIDSGTGKPFALRVVTPAGRDMPGVDFTIEFDTGEPLTDYMAGEPWSLPPDERRTPRFVTFEMPSYRLSSARLPLDAREGTTANFILTPNDFGAIDLTGARAEIDGRALTLHHPQGTLRFERVER